MFLRVLPKDHTMGEALIPYLRLKIPAVLHASKPAKIEMVATFRIDSNLIFPTKGDKRFNYIRPGIQWKRDGRLRCYCFPGSAYVFHYGSIYRSYFSHFGFEGSVSMEKSAFGLDQLATLLMQTGLGNFPRKVDIVVLGNVDRLPALLSNSRWRQAGLFEWKLGRIARRRIALLGCHHTLWADVSVAIMHILAEAEVKYVIYVGKLGSLDPVDEPNVTLATGGVSWLEEKRIVDWDNIFSGLESDSLRSGVHVTIQSLLEETESWLANAQRIARFVDPEIGHMASGAASAGIVFSYLHVISDNVSRQRRANLSNERLAEVVRQRGLAFAAIDEILTQRIPTL